MLAALTFIPSLISVIGDKIFWPRTIESYVQGSKLRSGVYGKFMNFGKHYFHKAGQRAIKYAVPIVVAAVVVSILMTYVMVTTESSYDMISIMPDCESKEGVDVIVDYADGGMVMPTYALYELSSPIAIVDNTSHTLTWTTSGYGFINQFNTISTELNTNDNIDYVLGPTPWAYIYQQAHAGLLAAGYPESVLTTEFVNQFIVSENFTALPEIIKPALTQVFSLIGWNAPASVAAPYIDYALNIGGGTVSLNGDYARLTIMMIDQPLSQLSMDTVQEVRSVIASYETSFPNLAVTTWTTGTPAVLYDISEEVNGEFNYIELGVIILIYVLLFFVLGSYLTPVRSLITILMSITWTIGLTHLLFTNLLGVPVTWIVPIVLLVVCLGLGMDYDILITTRIREGKKRGMSNDEAIINAMEKSGSIITLCGLIMGGTFLTLLVSSSPMLMEFGFALGFAILIDSLVMVTYVVPALMHLMGDWSWKGPKFLNRNKTE